MAKVKIPKDLKPRLADAAGEHGFDSADAFADHLVDKGLKAYDLPDQSAKLKKKLYFVVEEHGYSSVDEFITHALEKEMAQLEDAQSDEDIKEKLKGLGYLG